ncbi:MAG TPA: DeoR/GlpR family DNA-binding transcription regulator [Actinomycetota bacterium]|nr:DeoR/GlpR family DNA-binding transcription regulator [Actinomycetota bacterium]
MPQPLPAERRRRILELLRERGAVRASELVAELGVSEITIRRDLDSLARGGLLERSHGGATLPGGAPAMIVAPERAAAKRAIGRVAAALVRPGETVFLNGGTTTLEVFRHLSVPATIVSNNVFAALEPLAGAVELILLGGHVRSDLGERTVVGPFATETLRRTFATRAILGVGGVAADAGLTTPLAAEAEIARLMIEQTRGPVVVVADVSKLGAVSDFAVGPLEAMDVLVTDGDVPETERTAIVAAGVQVVSQQPNGER